VKIRTQYKANHNGTGQIVAKGGGRQRTVQYADALSSDANHGAAAGELAQALGLEWSDTITHEHLDDGRHLFVWS
jgi:hypothetical protein